MQIEPPYNNFIINVKKGAWKKQKEIDVYPRLIQETHLREGSDRNREGQKDRPSKKIKTVKDRGECEGSASVSRKVRARQEAESD